MLELLIESLLQFVYLCIAHNLLSYPPFLLLLQFILLQFCNKFFLLPLPLQIPHHPSTSLVQSRLLDRVCVLDNTFILIRPLIAAVKQHLNHATSCRGIRLYKSIGVGRHPVTEISPSTIVWGTTSALLKWFLVWLRLHVILHFCFQLHRHSLAVLFKHLPWNKWKVTQLFLLFLLELVLSWLMVVAQFMGILVYEIVSQLLSCCLLLLLLHLHLNSNPFNQFSLFLQLS